MPQAQQDLRAEVREKILALIGQMDTRKSNKLPPEKQLAETLGVSRSTLRTVLEALEAEGKVIRSHGSGTFVNVHAFATQTTLYPQVYYGELIARSGYTPSIQILGVQAVPAGQAGAAAQLGLAPNDEVVEVSKIYRADKRMGIYCMDYLPGAMAPARLREKLRGAEVSIFQFWAAHTGLQIARDMVVLTAGDSRQVPEIHGYLGIGKGDIKPLLVIDTTNFDSQNRPLLYSKSYVDTDIIKYHLMRNNFEDEEKVP